ncbi:hypothetical protein Pst134EA_000878 [Puccinia striiformis f. sp. tritici]|uniref:Uncharacterized protein n=1 Tax=Puccinia striiformis f. sp. tritici PST-78 TaxID=1165861 RepID=A0A0L0VYH1_9BASI|nr:hypothetical protein Pst134EA_000878 [Puccinia striiformis f. sp. tritici]KAH9473813.1 hypothetical protein Pst134EA_000878 [Puccinia striiformis f. sp. tritici]KAI9600130.1 hypothetical protein KEM48_000544 [Puccinia striiformis f. sp. tritici PST-130]KNF04242.1 hypothetical protein PSTG_02590 [Puccinia striiformis f. sp. tritici PST-78]
MATQDSVDHRNWSETVVFKLVKYSRSNAHPHVSSESQRPTPSASRLIIPTASQLPTIPSARAPNTPLEWSHFTQPGLSLVVESVHLDSQGSNQTGTRHRQIILKILWDNSPPSQKGELAVSSATDRPGVFLLDKVNLTAVQENFGHSRIVGESPLKANCKDCVIGIRYATGHLANSLVFNRIQVKLQTLVDALRFVAIIETICPCKISSGIQNSQSTRNNLSQPSINVNFSQLGQSFSQPSLDINTSAMESQGFGNQTQLSEPSQSNLNNVDSPGNLGQLAETNDVDNSQLARSESARPGHQTKESSALASSEKSPTLAADPANPSDGIIDLINSTDDELRGHIAEIIRDPGFDHFAHRIRSLLQPSQQ